jgi:DNA-binding GntR family transcriptional regulator
VSADGPGVDASDDESPGVYQLLRGYIVNGDLQPNERLVESDLTRLTGGTRSVVRDALIRLEHDGLVTREPNRGARVRMVSESEAIEITEARAALEMLTVRHAAVRASDDDVRALHAVLGEMRDAVGQGDLLAYTELNGRFHQAILAAAQHRTAVGLLAMLRSQGIRFQYRTILQPGRARRSLTEHEAIAESIAAHDPDAAEAAMRVHMVGVVETLRAAITRYGGRRVIRDHGSGTYRAPASGGGG